MSRDLTRLAPWMLCLLFVGCAAPTANDPEPDTSSVEPELPSGDEDTPQPTETADADATAPVVTPDIVTVDVSADSVWGEGIVAWDTTETPTGPEPCNCDGPTHCNEDDVCVPDVCEKGATTCADIDSMMHCDTSGASFVVEPCYPGQVCFGHACMDPICEPEALGGCYGTNWLACNSLGTEWVAYPCPLDAPCQAGACRRVEPNVLLVIDTSGSMNWLPNGDSPEPCTGPTCEASWSFPFCDNPEAPITRLGKVKKALNTVVQSEAASAVRMALQRFPQRPFYAGSENSAAAGEPQCAGGNWIGTDSAVITGDNESHTTGMESWFGSGLDEVIVAPFLKETNLELLSLWFDFTVETVPTETMCTNADICAGGPCVLNTCLTTTNPELRGLGLTPLGKSLFYAGEYFHHQVLIEGKPCASDLSCDSPHHTCQNGQCHDLYAHCRDNIIILFTDGVDTRNVPTADFFNPRVQAKRLHFGLGCASQDDCLAGATCVGGVCRAPSDIANATQMVCDAGEEPCTNDNSCPNPCGNWGNCAGACSPTEPTLTSNEGADHITDQSGNPVSIRVHVVDASGVAGNNSLIAVYGGGEHFDVDLDDPDELVASVYEILGDTKDTTPCEGE